MEKNFLKKVAEVLDTEAELDMEMELSEIEEWDSLGMVSFVAMADVEYDKKVVFADLKKAKTMKDLYALIQGEV